MKKIDVSKSLIFSSKVKDLKNALEYLDQKGYFSNCKDFSNYAEGQLDVVHVASFMFSSYVVMSNEVSKFFSYFIPKSKVVFVEEEPKRKQMKLYKHQEEALERTKNFNKVAFYHDMGLGKTFTGSEKMRMLNNNVNLIICQKSKVTDWIKHCEENMPNEFVIFDLTNKQDFDLFFTWRNPETKKIGIINYELVFRREELASLQDFTLLLDESSMIQNDKAKRTKAILKLKASNVILLSGTPVGGKYENLYSQLKLLGWKITKKEFWNNYINYELVQYGGPFSPMLPKIKGYKNVDDLKKMLKFHGADFLKSDEVFDLPSQNFNMIKVPISKEYKEFKKEKYICIEDKDFIGDTPLKIMLYARMMCSTYNKYKLDAFVDLIDSTDDRLIVFYNFTDELEALKKVIENRPCSFVNGSERDLSNYENVDNSITFVQYQAGAMGLNLQKANKIIYYSLPLSSELYEQSKKRIHRIGQNRPCFYYLLLAENSIEERIKTTLDKRNDYTQELFNEDF